MFTDIGKCRFLFFFFGDVLLVGFHHLSQTFTEFRGQAAESLQEVDLIVTDSATCVRTYESYQYPIREDIMFCAGHKEGGKDSCQGKKIKRIIKGVSTRKQKIIVFVHRFSMYFLRRRSRLIYKKIDFTSIRVTFTNCKK